MGTPRKYYNVSTPRFYIDHLSYMRYTNADFSIPVNPNWGGPDSNLDELIERLIGLNIIDTKIIRTNQEVIGDFNPLYFLYMIGNRANFSQISWYGIFNHNLKSADAYLSFHGSNIGAGNILPGNYGYWQPEGTMLNLQQYPSDNNLYKVPSDGFTLSHCGESAEQLSSHLNIAISPNPLGNGNFSDDLKIGSIACGRYYDMPITPSFDLSMSVEYESIKTQKTLSGKIIKDNTYTSQPSWGENHPWTFFEADINEDFIPANNSIKRTGRRVWDLTFDHMSDADVFSASDLFMATYNGNAIEDYGNNVTDTYVNYYEHQGYGSFKSFFNAVVDYTHGGNIPFIFSPNNQDIEQSTLAKCKLDMDSISFNQISNKVYTVNIKIREVW